jgi:hypothetical protein
VRVDYVAALTRDAPRAPAPFGCAAYLFLPLRELAELVHAQSRGALDLARAAFLEVPR